mgnify:CR=1 FL=1
MKHNVAIYTTPTCHFCRGVKEFFKKNKIKYTEVDVTKDKATLREMVEKSGSQGVPVILIDNDWEKVIIGFNESKLRQRLNISS